ncbi:MAG: TonB-dependent receptor plug domain-containing protein [Magnetococcales bacterium]|nr:TonB-dependent receptor plug domain-containing protein [Magnetococcales bacterium]
MAAEGGESTTSGKGESVRKESGSVLKEVVVTAPRIEEQGLVDGTTRSASDMTPIRPTTSDAASLLKDIPGVSLYTGGGVSSLPVVHGLADDRLKTQVDGMNLISACPNHMNPTLSYIDPNNVGSVKVFSGVSPVSVGGDSIGGTIQVNSKEPEFAKAGASTLVKGQAGTFYRSNGDAVGGNLSATVAGDIVSFSYNGSTAKSDNYTAAKDFKAAGNAAVDRGWLPGDEVGSSRYKTENHEVGMAMKQNNHLVELKLGLQHIPYQDYPNQRMDMTLNESVHGNLHYTGKFNWGNLDARVYDEHTRHRMDFGPNKRFAYTSAYTSTVDASAQTLVAPGMPMNTDGTNLGVEIKGEITLSERDTLRLGIEGLRHRLDDWWPASPSTLPADYPNAYAGMAPNTFWNIRDGERDRIDLFAEWEARWNPQWSTQLGIRSDNVMMNTGPVHGYNNMQAGMGVYGDPAVATSVPGRFNAADRQRTDNNIDLTGLLRYTPGALGSYEAGFARKSRSPNLYERYAWSVSTMAMEMINMVGDGNYYIGNLNLKPEVANTFSITADWHGEGTHTWNLKLTPYFTHIEDYIDVRRCPTDVCSNANGTPSAANGAVDTASRATTGYVYLQYVNQTAQLYGLDLSGDILLNESPRYGSFTLSGLVNYVKGENRTTGDNLYNIMPLNGKLALAHRREGWTGTIEEQLVASKDEVSQTRNEVKTGGYGLLNLRGSYDWEKVRLDLGVENVLDQFYNLPLGGAYVGQGSTMSGGAVPWGTPVPGMGRTFYTGLSVKF